VIDRIAGLGWAGTLILASRIPPKKTAPTQSVTYAAIIDLSLLLLQAESATYAAIFSLSLLLSRYRPSAAPCRQVGTRDDAYAIFNLSLTRTLSQASPVKSQDLTSLAWSYDRNLAKSTITEKSVTCRFTPLRSL
jgi:hypothetical protein